MEEKEEKKVNAEELKSEASTTVNQVKDTIKNVDIKKDSIETKGFISELFKDPLGKIKEIVDKKFDYLIIAIKSQNIAIEVMKELTKDYAVEEDKVVWRETSYRDFILE